MHLVSNVKGELKEDEDIYSALEACFPAGTVSGAPKIRAMEIIDELETTNRGPYAGGIGYFGYSGNLDTCITIRTIVVNDNKAYVQAGAGIVADSKPEAEYQETLNKAEALLEAVRQAEGSDSLDFSD
jgi:anthranilate synthase component 1